MADVHPVRRNRVRHLSRDLPLVDMIEEVFYFRAMLPLRTQSCPRVKAVARRGRGALRYELGTSSYPRHPAMESAVRLGGATAFRREAAALKQAEHQSARLRTLGA